MQSRIGRPDLGDQLDVEVDVDPVDTNSAYLIFHTTESDAKNDDSGTLNDEEDVLDAEIDSSASDESEWGTVNGNLDINAILNDDQEDVAEEDVKLMYVPEPVLTLNDTKKPQVPQLPIEKFPVGCQVWVVDEEDVELLLRDHWGDIYRNVCNGRLCGTVMRHSGNLTLVAFHDERRDIHYSLSLPRACLSITPIDAYERSQRSARDIISSLGLGTLDPRPARSCRSAGQRPCRQLYEPVSVLDVEVLPSVTLH